MRSWSTFKTINSSNSNSWDDLQNKPAILLDDQINWDEIQNKPTIETVTEATFTPVLTDSGNFIYSLLTSSGKYKRVGNVYNLFVMLMLNLPQAGTGNLLINLPFSCLANQFVPMYFMGTLTNYNVICVSSNDTDQLQLFYQSGSSATTLSPLRRSNLRSSGSVRFYCNGSLFIA